MPAGNRPAGDRPAGDRPAADRPAPDGARAGGGLGTTRGRLRVAPSPASGRELPVRPRVRRVASRPATRTARSAPRARDHAEADVLALRPADADLHPADLHPADLHPADLHPADLHPADEAEAVGAVGAAEVVELVARARRGDTDAFGALYDRYRPVVQRYVYSRVAGQAAAEDIVSETFLRALRGIGGFTWQGRDVGAWFVTIARNLVVDHVTSNRFRLERPTDDISSAGRPLLVDGPEDSVITLMTNQLVRDAIRALGREQQECVVLRFLEGMSVRETALAMGKNEGAIKALQHRAVRALARQLPADPAR